jgi:hypothetical protein
VAPRRTSTSTSGCYAATRPKHCCAHGRPRFDGGTFAEYDRLCLARADSATMRPYRPTFLRSLSILVAFAISLVVGLASGSRLVIASASVPAIVSCAPRPAEDVLKAGERLEPRVLPAPLLDRRPAVPPVDRLDPIVVAKAVQPPQVADLGRPSIGDLRPIVKHVPRLERGDPPRV